MVKIGHIADVHLGAGKSMNRVDEIAQSFDNAVMAMEQDEQVEVLVIAGDVFDAARPTFNMMAHFVKTMKQTTKPVIVIAGNHDTVRLRTSGSAWELLEAILPSNIFLATGYESKLMNIAGMQVMMTPWGAVTDPKDQAWRAEEYIHLDQNKPKLWVTHGIAEGAGGPAGVFGTPIIMADEMGEFDYVALGDLHTENQVQVNAWYSGSTDRMNWSDYEAKPHWLKVDVKANVLPKPIVIPLKTKDMEQVVIDTAGMTAEQIIEDIEERAADLDADAWHNFVFDNISREHKSAVSRALTKMQLPVKPTFHLEERKDPIMVGGRSVDGKIPSLPEMFAAFVESRKKDYSPEFAERFAKQGAEALDQALKEDANASELDR